MYDAGEALFTSVSPAIGDHVAERWSCCLGGERCIIGAAWRSIGEEEASPPKDLACCCCCCCGGGGGGGGGGGEGCERAVGIAVSNERKVGSTDPKDTTSALDMPNTCASITQRLAGLTCCARGYASCCKYGWMV